MQHITKRFIKDAKVYTLGPFIDKAIAILLVPLYTSYLTTEDYGRMSFIMTVGGVFSVIVGLGLGTAFWKYYKKVSDNYSRGEIVFIATILPILAGLVLLVLIVIPLLRIFPTQDSGLMVLYLFGTILFTIYNMGLSLLRAEHKAKTYLIITSIMGVLRVLLVILMVAGLAMGYKGAIGARSLFYILTAFVGLFLLRGRVSKCTNKELYSTIIAFSIPLMLGNISSLLMNFSDKLSLNYILGKSDLGLYTFALNFGMLTKGFIIVPFFMAWSPVRWELFYGDNRENKFSAITKIIIVGFCIAGIIASALAVLAATALSKNDSFNQAIEIIPMISITQVLWGLYNYELMGFHFSGKTKSIPYLILFAGLLNIGLNLVLIPTLGYSGAAVATLISFFILRLITAQIGRKLFAYRRNLLNETMFIIASVTIAVYLGRVIIAFDLGIVIALHFLAVFLLLVFARTLSLLDGNVLRKLKAILVASKQK
ncbi:MAG: oligosaccharide flippase family protein [Candidatus Sabulitectum sp.]|nr:oligosaccharide flippase family protein [Candidatus Sabulitectum sp.]